MARFFNDRWDLDNDELAAEAAKFGLNPDRALFLRDILKAAEGGMTEEDKAALLERAKGCPPGFRLQINTFTVGEKFEHARELGSGLSFKDLAGEDRVRSKAEIGLEILENLPGRGKISGKLGAKQNSPSGASSNKKNQQFAENEYRGKVPDVSRTLNPITPDGLKSLGNIGEISPFRVRTMQDSIGREFTDSRTLRETIKDILEGKEIPAIRLAVIEGKVYTLDHRRLVAHRIAKKDIRFVLATSEEIQKSLKKTRRRKSKFSTIYEGMSINIRGSEDGD